MSWVAGNLESKKIFEMLNNNKNIFIETGTQSGNGVKWALGHFDKVISIEILDEYYNKTNNRFVGYSKDRLALIKGNSGDVIESILSDIDEACFIYLDAHGDISDAGPNPLYKELSVIKEHKIKNHLIVIDDVRRFGDMGDPCWSKIDVDVLKEKIKEVNDEYEIFIHKDMLIGCLKEDLK